MRRQSQKSSVYGDVHQAGLGSAGAGCCTGQHVPTCATNPEMKGDKTISPRLQSLEQSRGNTCCAPAKLPFSQRSLLPVSPGSSCCRSDILVQASRCCGQSAIIAHIPRNERHSLLPSADTMFAQIKICDSEDA